MQSLGGGGGGDPCGMKHRGDAAVIVGIVKTYSCVELVGDLESTIHGHLCLV